MRRKKKPIAKLGLDLSDPKNPIVRTLSDMRAIREISSQLETRDSAFKIAALMSRGIKPKWSFIRTISKRFSKPINDKIGPRHIGGIGLFKCKQTGEVMELDYKVAA